ncbi:hypothetical protein K788_0008460 [Paraburkholderia caribensis MBA4]|uniref:Uncharacterized protein n=1 Tax=Paraburkholderia caribensis MBA4 TaxID=1323664 RepID=A0A0P0R4I2_9BURK|nr:hypothetical protein K788_0008460 [Paraburkholderia caribensis MBA4]
MFSTWLDSTLDASTSPGRVTRIWICPPRGARNESATDATVSLGMIHHETSL